MNWINGEPGPDCFCGCPTFVNAPSNNEQPMLICMFHTYDSGATFYLSKKKPEAWPNLSFEEIQELVDQGIKESGKAITDD